MKTLVKVILCGLVLLMLTTVLIGCGPLVPVTDYFGITNVERDKVKAHNEQVAAEEKETHRKCDLKRVGYGDYTGAYKTLLWSHFPESRPKKENPYMYIRYNSLICTTKEDLEHMRNSLIAKNGQMYTQYLDTFSRRTTGSDCVIFTYPNDVIGYVISSTTTKDGFVEKKVLWRQMRKLGKFQSELGWVSPQISPGVYGYDLYSNIVNSNQVKYRVKSLLPNDMPDDLKKLDCPPER